MVLDERYELPLPGITRLNKLVNLGRVSPRYFSALSDLFFAVSKGQEVPIKPLWARLSQEITNSNSAELILELPVSEIGALVNEIDDAKLEVDQLHASEKALIERRQQLIARYQLILGSLGETVGINRPVTSLPVDLTIALPFYTDGVLESLPVLEGLSDAIPDLPTLREQLQKLKAVVPFTGPDAQTQFLEKIESLRLAAKQISEEDSALMESSRAVIQNIANGRERAISGRTRLQGILTSNQHLFAKLRH